MIIRLLLTSFLYLLALPEVVAIKLFGDPMALRKSQRGWKKWPKDKPGVDGARRPY